MTGLNGAKYGLNKLYGGKCPKKDGNRSKEIEKRSIMIKCFDIY